MLGVFISAYPAYKASLRPNSIKTFVAITDDGRDKLLGKAKSAAECDAKGGWHYDDEASPTKVLVCPATCDLMQAADEAEVKVLFGCATKPVARVE